MTYRDPVIALPASVRLEAGRGGLPVLLIDGPAARAEIYLQGANVTEWTPRGRDPVLWLSSASRFTRAAPIRGGVPICFPWFGPQAGHPEAPSHGFARLSQWSLLDAQDDGESVTVRLRLTDGDATGAAAWPHRFEAVYTATVGARLSLSLTVTNLDEGAVVFEEALHTYLDVPDIRTTEISGLEGAAFYDKLAGPEPVPGEPDPVAFGAPTDRIYLQTTAPVTVSDTRSGRSVRIAKDGSENTVVWNPWLDGARDLPDLGDDEWQRMVCVEACNVRDAAVRLEPGQSHTMTAIFELRPLPTADPPAVVPGHRESTPPTTEAGPPRKSTPS